MTKPKNEFEEAMNNVLIEGLKRIDRLTIIPVGFDEDPPKE